MAKMSDTLEDLVPIETEVALVPSAEQLETNVKRYQEMQSTLDRLMPDQIMLFQGELFRKKGYWLAIAQGFGLILELRNETRQVFDGDFGYTVTYRATDPRTGRYMDGDGSCSASEKADRRGGIGGTEHNVRAHAHTRAKVRAISGLVAFGEVGADELQDTKGSKVAPTPVKKKVLPPAKTPAQASLKAAPKPPAPTLESYDGAEYIKEVKATRTLPSGTVVYHIFSTTRKYVCLDQDTVDMAQHAETSGSPVEVQWEEKTGKPRNGKPGAPFNALGGITVLTNPEPISEEPTETEPLTDADIPF
jgi:hypothetical protein